MNTSQQNEFDNIIGRLRFVLPKELKQITNKEVWGLLQISENTFYHWQANKAYPDSESVERLYNLMVEWKVNPDLQIWVVRKRGGPHKDIVIIHG